MRFKECVYTRAYVLGRALSVPHSHTTYGVFPLMQRAMSMLANRLNNLRTEARLIMAIMEDYSGICATVETVSISG